ncbi:hypothetical protein PsYK624_070340 [Phanerochaete sordida]|uniref:Uncharacterized protein n=1 Tax=Phanerochaete sordida TaxID=48140 RepID=A0A9P3G7S2_9APHY|nr:hypothetical protein PsYK624_070340 [Phanerochaete sordida]
MKRRLAQISSREREFDLCVDQFSAKSARLDLEQDTASAPLTRILSLHRLRRCQPRRAVCSLGVNATGVHGRLDSRAAGARGRRPTTKTQTRRPVHPSVRGTSVQRHAFAERPGLRDDIFTPSYSRVCGVGVILSRVRRARGEDKLQIIQQSVDPFRRRSKAARTIYETTPAADEHAQIRFVNRSVLSLLCEIHALLLQARA